MASTALPNGNGIANGHIPHTIPAVSSQSASTERIQIVNEEKEFTLVSSGCLPHSERVVDSYHHFFVDQT